MNRPFDCKRTLVCIQRIIVFERSGSFVVRGAKCNHLPQCCHGDYGVPKSSRDTGKLAGCGTLLCIKHHSGEYDDGHREREQEEA